MLTGPRVPVREAVEAAEAPLPDIRGLKTHFPTDEGIVQALWLTPEELQAQAARHRSPLVWRVVEDFLAGRRHALDVLQVQSA